MAVTAITGILVSAQPANAWIGVCEPCGRGVRTDAGHGDRCTITCPGCGTDIPAERVYGTVTAEPCDDKCMGATRKACACACGGANHGGAWTRAGEALAMRLRDRTPLSGRQIDAAARAVTTAAGRRARQEARDKQAAQFAASAQPVPSGRITFAGEILTVRYDEPQARGHRGSFKCLILTDPGYKLWGTMPGALLDEARNEVISLRQEWDLRLMNGRRIEITATVTPKPGEAGFGFFSRPAGRLLAPAAA